MTLTMPYDVARKLRSVAGDRPDALLEPIWTALVVAKVTRHDGEDGA